MYLASLGVAEMENRVAVQILNIHRRALPQEELDNPLVPLRSSLGLIRDGEKTGAKVKV